MPNLAMRALIALAVTTAVPAAVQAQAIEWTATPASKAGNVRLKIERNSPGSNHSNSSDVAAANLRGLDLARDGDQRFVLTREAGSLDCSGAVRSKRGTGECRFAADPRFAEALARAGMGRPSDKDSFTLMMVDANLATLRSLKRFGTRPSIGDYVALSIHGANPVWIDELAGAGQRNIKPGDLIAYRIHGVSGGWLRGLVGADPALGNAKSGDIIAMRIHGVQPDWVRGIADAGYRNLPASDLIAMRIHGVTPAFARAAVAMGPRPSAGELISRRIMGRR